MKKVLLLLCVALYATTISSAQTKRRIFINLNVTKQMEQAFAAQVPSYAQYISEGKSEYIAPPSNNSPVYLAAAEPRRTYFSPELNQSDSATTIRSKVDPDNNFAFTGLYDFPYRVAIGNIGQIVGLAQFLPPLKGNFVIDTVALTLFKPTSGGLVVNPVLNDVLLYPVTLGQDITNFNTLLVRSFEQNLDNFIGDEPLVIKADTINTRVANNTIRNVILTAKNLTIPAGTSSAFMLRPQSTTDTMRWLGTFEWDVKADSRIYGAYITRPAGMSGDQRDSLLRALSIGFYNATTEFKAAYPSLADKGFRTNYSLILGGMYDGDDDPNETYATASGVTSVEEVGAAQPLAIRSITPNPMTEAGSMTFSLEHPANVEITIINAVGQTVGTIAREFMQPGTFNASVDVANLPGGMYSVMLNAGGFRAVAPISVIR